MQMLEPDQNETPAPGQGTGEKQNTSIRQANIAETAENASVFDVGSDVLNIEPDFAMAQQHLSVLAPPGSWFTFQVFDDRAKHGYAEIIHGPFDEAMKRKLRAHNRKGRGIYVSVNETDFKGRKTENIVRIRAVFHELDAMKMAKGDAAGAEILRNGFAPELAPSIEVESSPGNRHNWILTDELSFDDYTAVQRRLIADHASDKDATDLPRVLRVAGFFHCKNEPVMVRLLSGSGRRYSREEVFAALPPLYVEKSAAPKIEGDMAFSPAAEALVRSWITAIPGNAVADYQTWFNHGLMFARLGDDWANDERGDDVRLELWEALSRKAFGFEDNTGCAEKWDKVYEGAATSSRSGGTITFRSLQWEAERAGWTWENSAIDPNLLDDAKTALRGARGVLTVDEAFEAFGAVECVGEDPPYFVEALSYDAPIEPRQWIVENTLARKFVTAIVGDSGTGKTQWIAQLAVAIASGKNLTGHAIVKKSRVWAINNEDDQDELNRRISAARRQHGISDDDLLGDDGKLNLIVGSGVSARPQLVERNGDGTLREGKDVPKIIATIKRRKIDVLKLDPVIEFHQAREGDNIDMNFVVAVARRIAVETNCAVLLVFHTRKPPTGDNTGHKGNANALRGASSQNGVARITLTVDNMSLKEAKSFKIAPGSKWQYLSVTGAKNNLGPVAGTQWYERTSITIQNGEKIGNMVPVTLEQTETAAMFELLAGALAIGWPGPDVARINAVIDFLPERERDLFGTAPNRARVIKEGLAVLDPHGCGIKTKSGVLKIEQRGRGTTGGYWVELVVDDEPEQPF
jgi:AAA domain/RepB DNA-primase from phage plasmid/Primase C terminal 2 (PriCT-2)